MGTCARTLVTAHMAPHDLADWVYTRVPHDTSLAQSTLDRLKPLEVLERRGTSLR